MNELANRLCKRLNELRAERAKYEAHWTECYRYGAPERQQCFASGEVDLSSTREKQRADLLDSTAAEAVLKIVATLIAGTTPANAQWFKAVPDGIDDPAVLTEGEHWLEQVCQFMFRNIHGANFDSENFDQMIDFVVAGWSVIYEDIDRKKGGGYVFQTWPIGECFIASTRQDNQVDTIYREYSMTAAQLVNEFGKHKVSQRVLDAYEKTPDMRFKIAQAIEPRKVQQTNTNQAQLPRNLPFASYHIEIDSKTVLKESGYNEFPCAVPRFRKVPGSVYGIGLMSNALPEAKAANALMRDTLRSAEIDVLGFWIAADDGVLNPRTVRIGGGKIVTANTVDSMKRLDSGRGFQVADPLLGRLQDSIKRKLMADGMDSPYNQPMTAAETYMRLDMIRQQIGPLYGRAQAEMLVPLLERSFGLAYRSGILGEAPEDLQGRNMSFKFISPLARAQQLEDVGAIERFIALMGPIAEMQPDTMDHVDTDAIPQVVAQRLGVPTSIMRTDEKVQAYRQQKAAAQQQAAAQEQQAMMAQQVTGAVAQGVGKGIEAQMMSEVMQ
ncbi:MULTISPECIES: portal protein [unclassified Acinetobacter]|uniref:portal protein n=1 Tax=unclassified Acinetobacter TaxID=196816 RepID=UPI0015D310B2|nr:MULTISPECIES: portal protein [unclassified Acinetobacter]